MKKILMIAVSFGVVLGVSAQLKFPAPYLPTQGAEPVRSEFLSYRTAQYAMQNNRDSTENFSDLSVGWKPTISGEGVQLDREFIVPFDYMDRALYMHIGAVNGAYTLYINGREVGHRTDSRTPGEFNISKFVERGLNTATIKVSPLGYADKLERSIDKSELDILRPVYLFAQPKIRVFDILMRTSLDPTYNNGLLEIGMLLKTELLNTHQVTVYYDLFDPKGNLVNQEFKDATVEMRQQDTIRFTATIMNVDKWSAESPALYTVMFRIKREGRFTEYVTRKVGFRTIETTDKVVINGNPVQFRGVNADMYPWLVSDATPDATLLAELKTLKYEGVNAIRTPYPLRAEFYDICDSIGLYVISNANINSQGAPTSIMKGGTLANVPAWSAIYVDRVIDGYEYAKVHPSVIAWGLGDQAGNGYNMYQAYNALRQRETTRPIVYQGADMEWNTDWYMPHYPDTPSVKPVQPTVYSRSTDVKVWDTPGGGFLSNSQETNLTQTPANITTMVNGKYAFVSIKSVDAKKGVFEITNNLPYFNLSKYGLTYKIYNSKGKLTSAGVMPLDVAAQGKSAIVTVPAAAGKTVNLTIGHLAQYKSK